MQTRIQSLQSSIERIKARVADPYAKIASRTVQLSRLQATCDLLRTIIRVMYLSKRLQGQLQGGAKDLTKAANSLNELEYLMTNVDVSGIEVVEADRVLAKQARQEVETQAQRMLDQGMQSQNQSQMGGGLQVFFNLGMLGEVVGQVEGQYRERLTGAVRQALSVDHIMAQQKTSQPAPTQDRRGGPGRASMPMPGNMAAFRATLWTNMEKLMDSIYSACGQIHNLQKVLLKKRDPTTHTLFMAELTKNGRKPVMHSFWLSVADMLREEFDKAANGSGLIRQALEGEYPKLLRLYGELWRRLDQYTHSIRGDLDLGQPGGLGEDLANLANLALQDKGEEQEDISPEKLLRAALAQFETAYLARSLSRLLDPVNLVFTGANMPTQGEMDNIVSTIASELQIASVDEKLRKTTEKNVATTVKLVLTKCEGLMVLEGEDASQVISAATPAQLQTAAVANLVWTFRAAVEVLLPPGAPPPDQPQEGSPVTVVGDPVREALAGADLLLSAALHPLIHAIQLAFEAIIVTMHQEDFGVSEVTGEAGQCSLYMKELQNFILHVAQDLLHHFHCTDILQTQVQQAVSRCITLFVRHACLVRPVGEGGKARLAADCAQLEAATHPLCQTLSSLGPPYRLLRAFKPMLYQTVEDVASSPAVPDPVSPSLALTLMFSKSGDPELRSPHQVAGWSPARYSRWLDEHTSEQEHLALIKGTLESYVQGVRARQGKSFSAAYPVMLDLINKAFNNKT